MRCYSKVVCYNYTHIKDNYVAALLEDMNSKIDAIADGVLAVNEKVDTLAERVSDIGQQTQKIPLLVAAQRDDVERIRVLEQKLKRAF